MEPIFMLLAGLVQLYSFAFIAYAVMGWVPNLDRYHPAVRFITQITEPVLDPIRQLIPPLGGMIDLSPMIAFIALQILESFLSSIR